LGSGEGHGVVFGSHAFRPLTVIRFLGYSFCNRLQTVF
jgi:hypothetical protein